MCGMRHISCMPRYFVQAVIFVMEFFKINCHKCRSGKKDKKVLDKQALLEYNNLCCLMQCVGA